MDLKISELIIKFKLMDLKLSKLIIIKFKWLLLVLEVL